MGHVGSMCRNQSSRLEAYWLLCGIGLAFQDQAYAPLRRRQSHSRAWLYHSTQNATERSVEVVTRQTMPPHATPGLLSSQGQQLSAPGASQLTHFSGAQKLLEKDRKGHCGPGSSHVFLPGARCLAHTGDRCLVAEPHAAIEVCSTLQPSVAESDVLRVPPLHRTSRDQNRLLRVLVSSTGAHRCPASR